MGLREWLIPREKEFFVLLSEESKVVLESARILQELIDDFPNREFKLRRIRELEHECDTIVHRIYDRLDRTFITPIDHEDLGRLASHYDDVVDGIHAIARRIIVYEIPSPTPAMQEFTDLLVKCVTEIDATFNLMQKLDEPEVDHRCIEVDRLENLADDLLNTTLAALFKTNEPIQIMKLKEIYEWYESTTDRCEDVTDVIRDIVLKHG